MRRHRCDLVTTGPRNLNLECGSESRVAWPRCEYGERQHTAGIQAAIDAIRSHPLRGDLSDGLVFGAVPIRLLGIGGAVKALPDDLLATQPSITWWQITWMRGHLATPLLRHRACDLAGHGR